MAFMLFIQLRFFKCLLKSWTGSALGACAGTEAAVMIGEFAIHGRSQKGVDVWGFRITTNGNPTSALKP